MLQPTRFSTASFLLASCLAFAAPLHAEADDGVPPIRFSGFGSAGFVHNQGDGSLFIRDLTEQNGAGNRGLTWEIDSRLGAQLNMTVTENLEAVAQVISRYRTDNTFRPELTWGFIKYTPNETVDLRIGRVGYDVFIGADSRDVGYSFLWVRPPVEFYGQLFNSYIDGGDGSLYARIGDAVGRFKFYSGLVRQQFAANHNQRRVTPDASFSNGPIADLAGSRMTGITLDYQGNQWTFKLARTDLRLRVNFLFDQNSPSLTRLVSAAARTAPPGLASSLNSLADGLEPNGKHVIFTSLGMAYENGPFQAQGGINRFTSGFEAFPKSNSGFVSLAYRLGSFTPYAVISAIRSQPGGRAEELAGLGAHPIITETARYATSYGNRNQHTHSIGMRHDFAENVALKFQIDRIRNKTCTPLRSPISDPAPSCPAPFLWPGVPGDWDGRATVYSAVLDFTF